MAQADTSNSYLYAQAIIRLTLFSAPQHFILKSKNCAYYPAQADSKAAVMTHQKQ